MLPQASAVTAIGDIENWILLAIGFSTFALRIWAVVDCLIRRSAAFPAAGKLTKPAWALITILSALLGLIFIYHALNLLSFFSLIASLVYLTDVRPSVREISGGSRW